MIGLQSNKPIVIFKDCKSKPKEPSTITAEYLLSALRVAWLTKSSGGNYGCPVTYNPGKRSRFKIASTICQLFSHCYKIKTLKLNIINEESFVLRNGITGWYGNSILAFWGIVILFSIGPHPLHPTNMSPGLSFLKILTNIHYHFSLF